jgi:hypothetical protein
MLGEGGQEFIIIIYLNEIQAIILKIDLTSLAASAVFVQIRDWHMRVRFLDFDVLS